MKANIPTQLFRSAEPTVQSTTRLDIDLDHFVRQLDRDPDAVLAIGHAIREDLARRIQEMSQAGHSRDAQKVQHHTHALKSSLAILAAREAERLAASLDHASRQGDWDTYDSTFGDFLHETRQVDEAIAHLLADRARAAPVVTPFSVRRAAA